MRVNQIICPKCKASLTSKAGVEVGTALACPKCKQKFAVAAPKQEEEVVDDFDFGNEEEQTPKKKPVKPAAKKPVDEDDEEESPRKKPNKPAAKKPVVDDDDEEEETPKRRRPVEDDDDEERPKAKKRGRDNDDDDRPRKKKKKRKREEELSAYGKLKANIWVRVSVLGVLLIGLGIAIWWRFIREQKEATSEVVVTKPQEEDYSKPITKDQLKKFPKVQPKVQPKVDPKNEPTAEPKVAKSDPERIQGVWNAVSAIFDGKPSIPEAVAEMGLTFKGNQVIQKSDPGEVGTFKLDPGKMPAEIDVVDKNNQTTLGIYRFDDKGNLEICINTDTGERPTEFVSAEGTKRLHSVMKRGAAADGKNQPKKVIE